MALPLLPTMMATTPLPFPEPAWKLDLSAPRPPRQLLAKAQQESCLRHDCLATFSFPPTAPLFLQLKPSSSANPSFHKALERMRKRGLQAPKETPAESTPVEHQTNAETKNPTRSTKDIQDIDAMAKEVMARKARRLRTNRDSPQQAAAKRLLGLLNNSNHNSNSSLAGLAQHAKAVGRSSSTKLSSTNLHLTRLSSKSRLSSNNLRKVRSSGGLLF